MIRMIASLVFWGFLALSSLVLFPIGALLWLVTLPFDRRRYVLHRFTSLWASLYTWLNPAWPVRVIGRERLHETGPAVIIANHLSLLDILVLFRLQSHFKWVSKIENFRVPVIGWNMWMCGYIPIRRGDKQSTLAMLRHCDRVLSEGSSILMFPEGTRSASGRLRAFHPGAFQIAARNRVPLQPIIVRGTAEALPKRGFVLQGRHPISIEILDPIAPSEFVDLDPEETMGRVRELFLAHLKADES
jgi:1-acyl-sn-glycerol-3-phosphate acyltransferase